MHTSLPKLLLALPLLATFAACEKAYVYEFDEVSLGADSTDRAPRARTNNQFIRSLYADLLARTPESYDVVLEGPTGEELGRFGIDEEAYLLFALDGVGDPAPLRELIAAGITGSEALALPAKDEVDDPAAFIIDWFRRLLGREPAAHELAAFVAEWDEDDAVGPRTVLRALVGSREYQSQ